jgi:uncharacterized membrane protein
MASSKARSRNRSGLPAGSGGSRPAARTAATKPQAAKAPVAEAQAAKPETARPQAGNSQARARKPRETAAERAKRQSAAAAAAAAAEQAELDSPAGPPRWLQFVSLALAVIGLGVSAYETYAHYTHTALAGCPSGGHGTFNCGAVITSPQSMVFNVFPVAVLGLLFYVAVTALMTPWAWRAQRREVGLLRLAAMITGMGFVMYLIYAEVVQIQQICEYCTSVHIITFLLFCITVVAAAVWGLGQPAKTSAKAS